MQMYTSFSWDGFTDQTGYAPNGGAAPQLINNSPLFNEWDVSGDPAAAAAVIVDRLTPGLSFQVYRSVLQTGVSSLSCVSVADVLF